MRPMKFAIFGNTYQAKKSTHVERLLSILDSIPRRSLYLPGVLSVPDGRLEIANSSSRCFRGK